MFFDFCVWANFSRVCFLWGILSSLGCGSTSLQGCSVFFFCQVLHRYPCLIFMLSSQPWDSRITWVVWTWTLNPYMERLKVLISHARHFFLLYSELWAGTRFLDGQWCSGYFSSPPFSLIMRSFEGPSCMEGSQFQLPSSREHKSAVFPAWAFKSQPLSISTFTGYYNSSSSHPYLQKRAPISFFWLFCLFMLWALICTNTSFDYTSYGLKSLHSLDLTTVSLLSTLPMF